MIIQELKPAAIRDSVADALRRGLMDRHFQPGESLSEVSLAAQFKVSRGPVREALLVLAQEGLVTHSQNRGFAVLELTEKDLRDIVEARIPMEAQALELARQRIGGQAIGAISQIKDDLVRAFREGDFGRTSNLDLAFHQSVWESSGNPWLVHALRRILVPYFIFTGVYHIRSPRLTEELIEKQHGLYVEYLRGGAGLSAGQCVEYHMSLARE